MMDNNDDILNRYFDGDLNSKEIDEVNKALSGSAELRKDFEALNRIHNFLSKQEADQTKSDFTNLVMLKIRKKSQRENEQKIFLMTILSIFSVIILGLVGFVLYQILTTASSTTDSTNTLNSFGKNINSFFSGLFSKNRMTLFGSILSFVMLVSAYFLFEFQKHTHKNLML